MGTSAYRLSGGATTDVSGVGLVRADFSAAFADDVLVAFPSAAGVVERMREPFLGDLPGEPLAVDVALTPRQALLGVTVPLDVPMRCTCRACGGRGESWSERCLRCAGSGVEMRQHPVLVSLPSRVADGARFGLVMTSRLHPSTRITVRVAVR